MNSISANLNIMIKAAEKARKSGIIVIEDKCIQTEHQSIE